MRQEPDQPIVEFRSPTRGEFLTVTPRADRLGEAVSLKLRLEAQLHGFSARERLAVADFASALLTGGFELDPGLLSGVVAGVDRLTPLFAARR